MGGTVTDYFYAGSEITAKKQGAQWTDPIFFGDQRIAQQTGATASTAIYLHTDHLGSTPVRTDGNSNPNGTCDYEPFEEFQPGSTCSVPTSFQFTGAQRDFKSGLYDFWFRQCDSTQGQQPARTLPGRPGGYGPDPRRALPVARFDQCRGLSAQSPGSPDWGV